MQRWFRLIAVSFFAAMLAATAHAQGSKSPSSRSASAASR
jgi:hypothetical protein